MALGTKLKDLLTERGITVKDFAKKIDVPPTTLYSFIKRDSNDVKLELITKICNGLGIKVTDFLKTLDDVDEEVKYNFDIAVFDSNKNSTKKTDVSHIIERSFPFDEYTEEEQKRIKEYAEFIKSKRN